MDVLMVSLGRSMLERGSREYLRATTYAANLGELHVIVLTRKEHGCEEALHEGNLHVYPTHSRTRAMMLVDALRIGYRIVGKNRKNPLTISAQDPMLIGWASWLLSLLPNTTLHIQVHGDYFSESPRRKRSISEWIGYCTGMVLIRRAPRVRVVSERIKSSLTKRGIPSEKITVLPIRPELERFLSVPRTVEDHDPFIFLATSRFAPEKNIPLIVRAFSAVNKRFPHTRLRLVGKGTEEGKIRALILSLDISAVVDIIPWTEAVEREMQQSDVFLSASDHEAYGLALVEALAAGLPVVTTDVGCVGEVIKDGVQGLVVNVRDEEAFTHAMERMVTDRVFRAHASRAGRATGERLSAVSSSEYARQWVASLPRERGTV